MGATYSSQGYGSGSQTHQPSLATVGVGGEGEVVLQGEYNLLDVTRLICTHHLLHSPTHKLEASFKDLQELG